MFPATQSKAEGMNKIASVTPPDIVEVVSHSIRTVAGERAFFAVEAVMLDLFNNQIDPYKFCTIYGNPLNLAALGPIFQKIAKKEKLMTDTFKKWIGSNPKQHDANRTVWVSNSYNGDNWDEMYWHTKHKEDGIALKKILQARGYLPPDKKKRNEPQTHPTR